MSTKLVFGANCMKIPVSPPSQERVFEIIKSGDGDKIAQLFDRSIGPCDSKGRYLHWDKLRHLTMPEGYDAELYWLAMRESRSRISKELPFRDKGGKPFQFCIPDTVMRDILWISENATGAIQADSKISDPKTKQTYLINSLIEEAINSSQLEGASTTRRVAKEMLRTGRSPNDHSEKMILNNYNAMNFIREYKDEILTKSMILELHSIVTEDTLAEEDSEKMGVFRGKDDDIRVYSHDEKLLHTPPSSDELDDRIQKICDFVNADFDKENQFIPPVIKAIVVHFMIGYDHPFVDGNGRTARALFYWIMAREGYWLMEYISISRVIKMAPAQYMYAYLHTETDSNDVTYFIIHQLEVIKKAIRDLHSYLAHKTGEYRRAARLLENSKLSGALNHRQLGLLKNALDNPGQEYTIKSHKNSHGVSYQTARTDLLALSDEFKILKKYKVAKTDVFVAPPNLVEIIKKG